MYNKNIVAYSQALKLTFKRDLCAIFDFILNIGSAITGFIYV